MNTVSYVDFLAHRYRLGKASPFYCARNARGKSVQLCGTARASVVMSFMMSVSTIGYLGTKVATIMSANGAERSTQDSA